MAKSTTRPRKPTSSKSSTISSSLGSRSGSGSRKKKKYSNLTLGRKFSKGTLANKQPLEARSIVYSYVPIQSQLKFDLRPS